MGNHPSSNNKKEQDTTSADTQQTTSSNQTTAKSDVTTAGTTDATTAATTDATTTTATTADSPKQTDDTKIVKTSEGVAGGTQESEEKVADNLVVRYEIRSMTVSAQNRFMDAIFKMCENKSGPGTSEYFRLAGYHGLPGPYYCAHGKETFPGWHRVYLREFEKALQAADKALGNDGNVFLPYWDWTSNPQDGLPSIVRKRFSEWPKDLFPKDFKMDKLKRADDKQIAQSILSYQVPKEATDCLLATQHFMHASTGTEWSSPYPPVESPHNSMHGIVGGNGGQMGNVGLAAFDVIFWLHHCNIDRIYAGYLQSNNDSQLEFEKHEEHMSKDLYEMPLEPFKKEDGTAFYPIDTFHTTHLNFKYDNIPKPPPAQLREMPHLVVFPQVRVDQFESKCYQIHVFLLPKGSEDDFKAPTTIDAALTHPNYAGSRSIFGRGAECENCKTREPYDIVIDVSHKLREMRLSRYKAVVKVLLVETTNSEEVFLELNQTPLPTPLLTGSLFEDKESHLSQTNRQSQSSEEVAALQRYLKRFGYYDEEVDGDFGPVTEQAVKDYQQASGLQVTGTANPQTKLSISRKKRCSNVDGFANNKVKDEKSLAVDYGYKSNLTYSIGVSPGYLPRDKVLWCIQTAAKQWADACEITMTYIDSSDEKSNSSDIWYEWSDHTLHEKNVLRFDVNSGVLGEGGNGFVALDSAERWVIGVDENLQMTNDVSSLDDPDTWIRGQPAVSLFHTVLHETGHALGLDHANNLAQLMAPFYNPERTTLTEGDKERAVAAWGAKQSH